MSTPSRARALRPYAAVAVLPLLLALLLMGPRLGGLLGGMWLVLVGTVGMAATARPPEKPNTFDPRGRLHG